MSRDTRMLLGYFIQQMVQAASGAALYSARHRRVVTHLEEAASLLQEAIADAGELSLILVESELFFGGRPLQRTPLLLRFVKGLKSGRVGHLFFRSGVGVADLELLMLILSGKGSEAVESEYLRIGSVDLPVRDDEVFMPIQSFAEMPESLKEELAESYEGVRRRQRLDMRYILKVVNGFLIALKKGANPFLALVPLREMDEYTFTHSIDVCILNLAQALSLGFEGVLLRDMGVAAMLHDVGKMFVPKEILNKPGDLTREEWEEMRQHTVRGAEYLLNTPGVPRLAVLSAFEHHLRFDVTGYPTVPSGWEVNLCSQMTMISDCFDAMRTKRIYKNSVDFLKTAARMLEIAGKNLHPALTVNFVKILHEKGEGDLSLAESLSPR